MKKQMMWKTKGMNQDLSVSAFNPEFSFENMNLRLSTNEGNTLMSWVNEKGTKLIEVNFIVPEHWKKGNQKRYTQPAVMSEWECIQEKTYDHLPGTPIGTAVINHKLVLFSTTAVVDETAHTDCDYIFLVSHDSGQFESKMLFNGNLNFSTNNPLETLVSYESEEVQKIYWVDGRNQPRVINIASGTIPETDTYFDFVPTLKLKETVTVQKMLGANGTFAPGVIQYTFTYYNKYGQESNIFYTTPLYYISYLDRGASPEDKVDNAFRITVEGIDIDFDYLRIYSIQRTSINGTPFCKRIQDIETSTLDWVDSNDESKGKKASYIDVGTSGDTVDPTELLYKGGEVIIPNTLEQKDGTLFLGNFKNNRDSLSDIKNTIKSDLSISENDNTTYATDTRSVYPTQVSSGSYKYANQLTSFKEHKLGEVQVNDITVPCGGFKKGDYYRCGVQFQHESGKWSDPIFFKDVKIGAKPKYDSTDNTLTLPVIKGSFSVGNEIINRGYKRIRPVVVFPEMKDRVTLCQGVVCPTLYTYNHRNYDGGAKNNDLYAQSSWFFRCPTDNYISSEGTTDDANVENVNVAPFYKKDVADWVLPYTSNVTESGSDSGSGSVYNPIKNSPRQVEIQGQFDYNDKFQVDTKTLTLHSPELEFDEQFATLDFKGKLGSKIGEAEFTHTFSDIEIQTESPTISNDGSGFIHRSFSKAKTYGIVSGLFYDDYIVDDAGTNDENFEAYKYQRGAAKWLVYPWQGSGSLNNDINRPSDKGTATAVLKKKIISNLRYAETKNKYPLAAFSPANTFQLFSSEECTIIKLGDGIYQGNIDTMLNPNETDGNYFCWDAEEKTVGNDKYYIGDKTAFNSTNWKKLWSISPSEGNKNGVRSWENGSWKWWGDHIGNNYVDLVRKRLPVRMKYKSTPHIVFTMGSDLDLFKTNNSDKMLDVNQLPIVEIQNTNNPNRFGGTSPDALKENRWVPCGEPVSIMDANGDAKSSVDFEYSYGDTYYQRWDCLKTYAFTPEDINQVVEIGSFMLETHVNIDGRYDRNRGQINNLYMSPQNFNLLNPVYSQHDNFFTYRIQDESFYANTQFPNQITWSKTKASDADVDQWTNVTLASVMELDGDKGQVNKLIRLNDQLLCFQDTGISQILYNENVQISSTAGVPIEIANSEKVQGKRYLSNSIGCSNKWSMTTTPNGIYFMDSNDKSIFLFNGQLQNLSSALGFNSWCKLNIPSSTVKWNPYDFENFVTYYDKKNQDVLFINDDKALAYSEKLGAFTSFYNYGKTPFFCNLDDTGIWINKKRGGISTGSYYLWKHQGGDKYCNFFGKDYPYWMTLVGNPEPTTDKIFTNLEFRACVDGDGEPNQNADKFSFYLPFDSLETWNEYQHGKTTLSQKNGHSLFKHGGSDSALIRKFRIWRCDIPRDNYSPKVENSFDSSFDSSFHGVSRKTHPTDRMRNPWLYLKLQKDADTDKRLEIHDMIMTYYN